MANTSGRHWVHYKPPVLGTLGVGTYDLLKDSSGNTRKRGEICSKLTI